MLSLALILRLSMEEGMCSEGKKKKKMRRRLQSLIITQIVHEQMPPLLCFCYPNVQMISYLENLSP